MLSFHLILLWLFSPLVAAHVGDLIMQGLGVKMYEDSVSVTSASSSSSSWSSQQSMSSTSDGPLIPTSTLPTYPTNATLSHTLPATGIIPSSAPTGFARTFDLSHTLTDTTIAEWDFGDGTSGTVACQNCSTFGDLYFTAAGFRNIQNTSSTEERVHALRNGSFLASFHGTGGTMQFRLTGVGTLSESVALVNIPTPLGYVIAGLGTVGLTLNVSIPLAMTIEAPADLTFGFSYKLPEDAAVNITLGALEDSYAHGFTTDEGLQFHTLPFDVNTTEVDLTLSASLQTSLTLGFTFLNSDIFADAGIFIDAPGMSVDITQVPTCNNNSTQSARDLSTNLFSNATEISPAIGIDLGVSAKYGAPDFHTFDDSTILLQASLDLPQTCLPNHAVGTAASGTAGVSGKWFPAVTATPSRGLPMGGSTATRPWATGSTALTTTAATTSPSVLPPRVSSTTFPSPSPSSSSTSFGSGQVYTTSSSTSQISATVLASKATANIASVQQDSSRMALVLLPFVYWLLSAILDMW